MTTRTHGLDEKEMEIVELLMPVRDWKPVYAQPVIFFEVRYAA